MPLTEHSLSNASAIVMTAVVFGLIFFDSRNDIYRLLTARTAALLSVFMWFLLEALRLPDGLNRYTQAEYDMGIACVALATGAFLLGYHRSKIRFFDDFGKRLIRIDSENVIWTLFLGGAAIGLAPMLYFANFQIEVLFEGLLGGQRRFSGVLQRGRYGDLRGALLELQMFLNAVVPLAAVLMLSPRTRGYRRMISIAFVTWMLLRANAGGTRSAVIPVLLPVAAAIFWRVPGFWQKRLIIVGIPLGLLFGYYYAAFVVANRNAGTADFKQAARAAEEYTGFEMFRELLFILDNVPDPIDYQYGKSYANQVINPIPRFLWRGKPIWDAGILLAEAKGNVDDSGTAFMTNSPGFVGEAYLNFGVLGLVLVPLLAGWVIRAWDRLFPLCGQSFLLFAVYAGGIASVFASGRGIGISTFYGMISLYLLMIAIETFVGSGRPRKPVGGRSAAPPNEVLA